MSVMAILLAAGAAVTAYLVLLAAAMGPARPARPGGAHRERRR